MEVRACVLCVFRKFIAVKNILVVFLLVYSFFFAHAQDSTVLELHEVTVTGFKEEKRLETSTDIITVGADKMRLSGAYMYRMRWRRYQALAS